LAAGRVDDHRVHPRRISWRTLRAEIASTLGTSFRDDSWYRDDNVFFCKDLRLIVSVNIGDLPATLPDNKQPKHLPFAHQL
jgi:hypothetical protein